MTNAPSNQGAPRDPAARLFRISLYIKGIDSFFELLIGALLFLVPIRIIVDLAYKTTRLVFLGHPDDAVSQWLSHAVQSLSSHQTTLAALYLFSHGAVKLFLVVMLLRNRLWAYPVFLVVLAAFVTYQIYLLMLSLSIGLIALTAFDILVMILTWHEYRLRRLYPNPSDKRQT